MSFRWIHPIKLVVEGEKGIPILGPFSLGASFQAGIVEPEVVAKNIVCPLVSQMESLVLVPWCFHFLPDLSPVFLLVFRDFRGILVALKLPSSVY